MSGDLEADGGESLTVLVVGPALVLAGVRLNQLSHVESNIAEIAKSVNARSLKMVNSFFTLISFFLRLHSRY